MSDENKNAGSSVEQFGYKQELKRVLTMKDLIVYGLLFIIVTAPMGVFGEVHVLSHGMTPIVYVVGLVAMIFTALSYRQMSNRFPIAGSVYSYVQRGINPYIGFLVGWLIMIDYFLLPALNYGFVGAWCNDLLPQIPIWVFIIVLLGINTFITYRGISLMQVINWIVFIIQIVMVVIFIFLGLKFIMSGGGYGGFTSKPLYNPEFFDFNFIATAATVACLSFLGFDAISTLAEETHQPEKNIGKGTVFTLLIVGGLFFLITYVAASVWGDLPLEELDPVTGIFQVAAMMGGDVLRVALTLVMLLGGAIGSLAAQAALVRILYSMSRDKMMPAFMGKIHEKHKTPYITVLLIAAIIFIVSFIHPMQLVRFVNFGALSSFIMLNFAVFWYFYIREKKRNSFNEFIAFLLLPVIGMFILGYVWSGFDAPTLILGFSWLAVGFVFAAVKTKGFKEVPEAFKNMSL
ncbi:MAG: APC family permease [Clostridiales bacterium]|nr:APC family permease [Clostridiales bacterium]